MADIRINALPTTATDFASDDYIAIDGTTNGTRKLNAKTANLTFSDVTLGTSGPSVKSTLSARAPRQGLVFDGTARASYSIPAFGTGDFSVSLWINQATLSNSAAISGPTNAFQFTLNRLGNGYLSVTNSGVAHVLDVNASAYIQVGKFQLISCVRSSGTVTFYVNGIAVGSGAVATDFSAGCIYVGGAVSTAFVTGTIAPYIYNRALSASEVVALYEAGAPAGADYNSASNTALNGAAFTNGNFTTFTSASATGFTATNTSGSEKYAQSNNTFAVTLGQRIRVTYSLSGTGTVSAKLAETGVQNLSSPQTLTAGTSQQVTFVVTTASANCVLHVTSAGSTDNFTLSSVKIDRPGLLLAPDAAQAGNGYVWNDQSGNLAQIVLPSSGVQWNLPSVATNRIRGTTSTNGNQQLLGASVLLPAECQITHVRARARSGTPTITIGTASGGAQIVASVALSTTWLNCTIALTGGIVSSADDIWIGSNSTDVVETDIAFQPLDF